jgi:hypothetical protein
VPGLGTRYGRDGRREITATPRAAPAAIPCQAPRPSMAEPGYTTRWNRALAGDVPDRMTPRRRGDRDVRFPREKGRRTHANSRRKSTYTKYI